MRKLLRVARAHVGVTLAASVVVLGGAGVATAVVVSPASSDGEVFQVDPGEATTAPATTTPAPPPPPAEAPVDALVVDTPAATVEDVPKPETTPAPETIPAPQVNPDGSLPEGWSPPNNPGEPPVAPYTPPTVEPLPGEPGYQD